MCKLCDARSQMIEIAQQLDLEPHDFFKVCVGVVLAHSAYMKAEGEEDPQQKQDDMTMFVMDASSGELVTFAGLSKDISEEKIYRFCEELKTQLNNPTYEEEVELGHSEPKVVH